MRVGLIDTGVETALDDLVVTARRFLLSGTGDIQEAEVEPDASGHGTALAHVLLTRPGVEIVNAQVFDGSAPASPATVAAGIHWAVSEGAQILNLSFGLRRDREVLRKACEEAMAAGVLLLAASPARGAPVFPSAYEGVIRVTGDARCGPGEFSALMSAQADIGACPRPVGVDEEGKAGGASLAVSWAVAEVVRRWQDGCPPGKDAVLDYFSSISRFHGPERRS